MLGAKKPFGFNYDGSLLCFAACSRLRRLALSFFPRRTGNRTGTIVPALFPQTAFSQLRLFLL